MLILILWLQLFIGVVVVIISFAELHTATLGFEQSKHLRNEIDGLRNSLDEVSGRVTPETEQMMKALEGAARRSVKNGGNWCLTSVGFSFLTVIELGWAYRMRRKAGMERSDVRQPQSH